MRNRSHYVKPLAGVLETDMDQRLLTSLSWVTIGHKGSAAFPVLVDNGMVSTRGQAIAVRGIYGAFMPFSYIIYYMQVLQVEIAQWQNTQKENQRVAEFKPR